MNAMTDTHDASTAGPEGGMSAAEQAEIETYWRDVCTRRAADWTDEEKQILVRHFFSRLLTALDAARRERDEALEREGKLREALDAIDTIARCGEREWEDWEEIDRILKDAELRAAPGRLGSAGG